MIQIKKNDLRKISNNFRRYASQVITASHVDQYIHLKTFIEYIDTTDVIKSYIDLTYNEVEDLEFDIQEVMESYGSWYLSIPVNENERLNYIYQVLKYFTENHIKNPYRIAKVYVSSNQKSDMARAFGNHFIFPFQSIISNYLNDIFDDLGYSDEANIVINANSTGVQVNVANNNSSVEATMNVNSEDEIKETIDKLINTINDDNLDPNMVDITTTNLKDIRNEIGKDQRNMSLIQSAFRNLKYFALGIATIPDFVDGIDKLGSLLGL